MSSAVHVLTVQVSDGGREQVVLRRYVRADVNEEEPDIAEREAQVLRFVEAIGVPTPKLVAVDPTGADAGVPSILMSRLAGRIEWSPSNVDGWLERLAALLPPIHGAPLPDLGAIRPFTPYEQLSYARPSWARWPKVWERAVEVVRDPAPEFRAVFIHRDFHPGNVLWRRGRVSGVVDWQAASIGPAWADVAHCRVNLFRYGLEVADRFTDLWERQAGVSYHPWAEIVAIVGFLDGLREDPGADAFTTEDALARAVAELGG
jgi:aminoglycoside phosphotransferase (APT) family kinase protein